MDRSLKPQGHFISINNPVLYKSHLYQEQKKMSPVLLLLKFFLASVYLPDVGHIPKLICVE